MSLKMVRMCFLLFLTWLYLDFQTGAPDLKRTIASAAHDQSTTFIAVVTSDKSHTRLKLLRDSPKSLVKRLNSEHKGGKSEDIARAPATSNQWVALEFDYRRKEYYVIDRLKSSLMVIKDDPELTNKTQVLLGGISSKVTALAYDWLRQVCYWTDPSYQAVLSVSIGHICGDVSCMSELPKMGKGTIQVTSVISLDLTEPCAIAVDPVRGYLYWADDGAIPSIEMSTLDGQNRSVLTHGLIQPAGLTIDYQNNILYWIERLSGLSVINSCLLIQLTCVPARVCTVYQSTLYDMDFHMGFLIASDLAENRLVIYDYTTGHMLRQNWYGTTYGVCVASPDRQLWKEISTSSMSPTQPKRTFKNITEHGVIFLTSVQAGILVMEKTFTMGHTPPQLFPLVEESGISTLAMDVRRRSLFFYSQKQQSIFRINLPHTISESEKGTRREIIKSGIKSASGLAVDWTNGNLYWLDSGYRRIMVSRDDGRFARVVHYENITNPQDLVIDSNNRFMFWSDVIDHAPSIERSDLDGYNRISLLHKNAFYYRPQALAIDFRKNRLYWSDGPFLCQATLNGHFLEEFKRTDYTSTAVVKAVDIMHDYILWTDLIGGLKSADVDLDFQLVHGNVPIHFSDTFFTDVLYFHESRQADIRNPCVIKYTTTTPAPSPIDVPSTNISAKHGQSQAASQDLPMTQAPMCLHLCLMSRKGPQCACATGYWLKSNGSCQTGVTVKDFLIFCDVKAGRLFRQFFLLPDYYVLPLADHTHVIDVALDNTENKIYWIDSGRNMIHAADISDKHHHVVLAAGNNFKMTQIFLEPSFRLLYIVTSHSDVIMMSLITRLLVFVVKGDNWTVHDLTVDVVNRQLYMTATSKLTNTNYGSSVVMATAGAILRADLDGGNLRIFLSCQGRPQGVTIYKANLIWTDAELQGVYSTNTSSCGVDGNTTGKLESPVVVALVHLGADSIPGDIMVHDDVVYFTDKSKQAVQRFSLNGPAVVTSLGFPFMNEISGLNYYSAKVTRKQSTGLPCRGISVPKPDRSECVCAPADSQSSGTDHLFGCQSADLLLEKEATAHGLCMIPAQASGTVVGGHVGDYVMSGQEITVSCDPGYLLSNARTRSEARKCVRGKWTSVSTCNSVLNYTVHGDHSHGYVVFRESTMFVVPRGVSEVDVVCIGAGGGGYDGCDKQLRKNRDRAGMGGASKFGHYLRAYGGQGGTLHEGGRGGRGISLFGGDGQLSSSCLGGGAAGETQSSRFCILSQTSCLFCGAGGAMPSCSVCPFRTGGCSGLGSETGSEPGVADNFGGGATGTFGGGSGGGGGFSRRTVRVSHLEEVAVKVGRGGVPTARSAGNGVVVVGWGARLENMIDQSEKRTACKPFMYKLNDEDSVNFPERCF